MTPAATGRRRPRDRDERDRRRAADRGRLRPRPRRRPRRAHPVRRRRLPGRRHELRDRPRRRRRRRRPARGRPAVLRPAGRRRHAPAGVGRRARGRRHARAVAPAHRADRRRPAGPAARPDGLRQPGHRRRRRRGRRAAAGRRRRGRPHRGRPDARRGRAVRGRRPRGRARGRLPRRADDAARPPRRGRRPERRLPLLRLARRRDRRPDRAARPRSAGSSATSRPSRRCRSRSGSASAGRPTSGRSRRPAPTASSSPRRWWTRSARTAATSRRWPARRRPASARLGGRRAPSLGRCTRIAVEIVEAIGAEEDVRDRRRLAGLVALGKTEELALDALVDYAPRYAVVAADGRASPLDVSAHDVVRRSSRAPAAAAPTSASRRAITELDRRPVDAAEAERLAALVEAAWTVLDRVAAARPGRAAQGPARRWPRPRQDGRPRRRGRLVLRPRDRASGAAARPGRSGGGRGDAGRDARRPAPAVGRVAARRSQVDRPLRGAPDRLARARPRLGDGGPDEASAVPARSEQPATSRRASIGRASRSARRPPPPRR